MIEIPKNILRYIYKMYLLNFTKENRHSEQQRENIKNFQWGNVIQTLKNPILKLKSLRITSQQK